MKQLLHISVSVLAIFIIATCLLSCKKDIPEPFYINKAHTVIVYMGAENNLSDTNPNLDLSFQDLEEMRFAIKDIPSTSQIIVFRDALNNPEIYHLTNHKYQLWKQYTQELNSADPVTMKSVLSEIITKFPSDKYSLVLWSHGSGWSDHTRTPNRSIIVDNNQNSGNSNSGSWMHISELAQTLSTLPKMEYIFFDACYMQSVEVVAELYPFSNYIIGSPTEVPGNGAPYHLILKDLCQGNPQGIIEGYASGYPGEKSVLLSAVCCENFPEFCQKNTKYFQEYFQKDNMPNVAGIQIYAPRFGYSPDEQATMPVPYDMRSAMHHILPAEKFKEWDIYWKKTILYPKSAKKWESIFNGYFHCSMTDPSYYGGISMNIPNTKYENKGWNEMFRNNIWYTLGGWTETGW